MPPRPCLGPAAAGVCYLPTRPGRVPGLGCYLRTYQCLRTVQDRPHPFPGHCGIAGPGCKTAEELTSPLSQLQYLGEQPHILVGERQPEDLSECERVGLGRDTHLPLCPSPTAAVGSPGGHKTGRTGPVLHLLQYFRRASLAPCLGS